MIQMIQMVTMTDKKYCNRCGIPHKEGECKRGKK